MSVFLIATGTEKTTTLLELAGIDTWVLQATLAPMVVVISICRGAVGAPIPGVDVVVPRGGRAQLTPATAAV